METKKKTYRGLYKQGDLKYFQIIVEETDLCIGVCKEDLTSQLTSKVKSIIEKHRFDLKEYVKSDPDFLTTLVPHRLYSGAPPIVQKMADASLSAGTGPMSAVAGVLSQIVASRLVSFSKEIIVENGGDIYLYTTKPREIGIFAGLSPFTGHIAVNVDPRQCPLAICTSSGTVGHAFSMGVADAVVVLSPSGALADAVATAVGNLIGNYKDLESAVKFGMNIANIEGVLAIKDDHIAAGGDINLVPL